MSATKEAALHGGPRVNAWTDCSTSGVDCPPHVPSTFETLDDWAAYSARTAMPPLTHDGRPPETVGQTLTRLIEGEPDPLPVRFIERFLATVAGRPETFGRVFAHGLLALKEAAHDG